VARFAVKPTFSILIPRPCVIADHYLRQRGQVGDNPE